MLHRTSVWDVPASEILNMYSRLQRLEVRALWELVGSVAEHVGFAGHAVLCKSLPLPVGE